MKRLLIVFYLVFTGCLVYGQTTTVQADIFKAKTEFWLKAQQITDIVTDTSFVAASNLKLATQRAIKQYVDNRIGTRAYDATIAPTTGYVIKWDGLKWAPAADAGGTAYTGGTGISVVGSVISNTGDTNAADDLTTASSAAGDVTGLFSNLQIAANAVGTAEIADNAVSANKIANAQITFAKIQNISTGTLMGRSTAGSGSPEQISPGSNLSIAGGVLNTNFTPNTGSGVNGQVNIWGGTNSMYGTNNLFWDNANLRLGIGTNTPGTGLEIAGNRGLKLPESSVALGERTLYWDNKDLLKFGPERTVEKATVWGVAISQNVVWNSGDYWDCVSIPQMEFGSVRITMESSGNSQGSYRGYEIPLSYANDTWTNDYGAPYLNDVWVYLSETVQYSRSWGDRFVANFKLAHMVHNGVHYFRLVCITTGEIRGVANNYGDASIRVKFYFSDNATLAKTGAWPSLVLNTTGTGMTLPTIFVPTVKSGIASRSIYRNTVTIGDGYKNTTNVPLNGLLVQGNTGIGTNAPLSRLDVKGNTGVSGNYSLRVRNSGDGYALSVGDDREVTFDFLTGSGDHITYLNNSGKLVRSAITPSSILTTSTAAGGDVTGTLANLQIVSGAVGSTEIADGTVALSDLASSSVNSAKIVNGSIDALDLSDQGASTGNVLRYGGVGVGWIPGAAGGDVSGQYTNLQIATDAVGLNELANGAVDPAAMYFSSYSYGSTVYSDGSGWVFGQNIRENYTNVSLPGGSGSYTATNSRKDNIITGSAWTSLTVNLPGSPSDGQECTIIFDVTVAAVTFSGNGTTLVGSFPGSIAVGDNFRFKYYSGPNKWYRITY